MLRVEKLTYEIKNRKLLKNLSFQIRPGELVAVLGANGAGKSTLMKIISGEMLPTEGMVHFNGNSLHNFKLEELAKQRALLSQVQQVNLSFSVKELVMMGRYPHFKSSPSINDNEIIAETMEICGVTELQDRNCLTLSGGEQQRVHLARVLAQIWDIPNALLLLDEPVSALDIQFQHRVLAIAKALSKKGFMILIVLHDLNIAATYADRIIMLKNGRKWVDGTPSEVLNKADIYSVFSVESTIEVDSSTLRPFIKLKEFRLEIENFNSKLLEKENDVNVQIKVKNNLNYLE